MYRIITTSGLDLGLTDEPRYIRRGASGAYTQAKREEAIGLAHKGIVYNLIGKTEIEGAETVVVVESSTAQEFERQEERSKASKKLSDMVFVAAVEEGKIDAAAAMENADVFLDWKENCSYEIGNIRKYEGGLYRCIQKHTSQTGWEPPAVPALWTKIGNPSDEWQVWRQPICAEDAWGYHAKVTHKDEKWVSDYANNVWEPGVFGWHKYVEGEEEGW